jgi:hypothetical protein
VTGSASVNHYHTGKEICMDCLSTSNLDNYNIIHPFFDLFKKRKRY